MRLLSIALCLAAQPAAAINLAIDYTYDLPANGGNNFFCSGAGACGNPQGQAAADQARAALGTAASFYSAILTDSFDALNMPFTKNYPDGGQATFQWTMKFNSPSTNVATSLANPLVAANQYILYVGGRALSGSELGLGGPGGHEFSWNGINLSAADQADANATLNTLATRGQSSGFADWGGTIAFDNRATTPWFFNYLATPSGNVADFYAVALHEMAHTLGFGTSTDWQALVSGSVFVGANAIAKNAGNQVPLSPDLAHWAEGTLSVVYGTATQQETLMDPTIQNGTRKKLTALDAAGLQDIGWSLGPAPGVNGDYNNNGVVDAGDYVVWRKRLNQNVTLPNDTTPGTVTAADFAVWRANFGKVASGSGSGSLIAGGEVPEPAAGLLAVMIGLVACFVRSTFRR
jgi:hypothetical protein